MNKAFKSRSTIVSRPTTVQDQPKQIVDPVEIQQACLQILNGTEGTYEIFQAKFEVHKHPHVDYQVIRFLGSLKDGPFELAKFRPTFFIPVTKFLVHTEKITKTPSGEIREWADLEDWEQFVLLMLSNTEMGLAKQQYFADKSRQAEDEEKQRQAATEAKKAAMLGSIMEKASGKPQPLKLSNTAGVLSATYATFEHTSGVTLFVCRDHHDNIVVRFKNANEGHPLYEQCRHNIFIKQEHLHLPTEDLTVVVGGKALLTRQAREWLRSELRAIGAIPPLDASLVVKSLQPEPTGVQTPESEGVYLGKPLVYEESAAS
jgi:hypothetical protein